jgi:hypothetical protein
LQEFNLQELKGLRDIKDIVQVPDISFYIFLALVIVGIVILLSIIIYIVNILKNRQKSKRKFYILKLKNIDFKDSKKAAYEITKYARKIANNKESRNILEQLLKELDKYKYIKNPPKFNDKSKKYMKLFFEVCCG